MTARPEPADDSVRDGDETSPVPLHGSSTAGAAGAEVEDALQLRWQVDRALRLLGRAQVDLLAVLARFDLSGQWALDGASSCAEWLSDRHGIARSTAREWLRVSHELQRCPAAMEAFESGRLSYSAARSVTRLTPHHPDRAAELIDLSTTTAINDLPRALASWLNMNESREQQQDRFERDTRLSVRTEADGMGVMTLVLPAVEMAGVIASIDAEVAAGKGFDGGAGTRAQRRSLAGQRARCLQRLITTGSGRSLITEVIVHVRADGCSLHDGTPIADHSVASLLPSSFIRALIHDAESRPIDASARRRHPSARQRRVVDERHGARCADCGRSDLIEYDHVPPFEVSGRTVLDELRPLCPVCHRKRHRGDGQEPAANC